jgi:hypothetical protein
MVQCISYLQNSKTPMIHLLYSVLIEFRIPRKLVGLINMRLNETYGRVNIDKNLSDKFPLQNVLK